MGASLLGCVGRMLALLGLVAILVLAWTRGPELWDWVRDGSAGTEEEVFREAVAADVLERYRTLVDGEVEEVSFTTVELQSVLEHALSDHLPEGTEGASVRLEEGELRLGMRVALSHLPSIPELERVRAILPDPVPIELRGALLTVEDGEAVFLVRRIDAAGIPLPRAMYAGILHSLDPTERGELPPEALRVPLPTGVRSAYIDGDRLVVTGHS